MTTSDILSRAADLIEQYGWVKGKYGDETVGFCAEGAVMGASCATAQEVIAADTALRRHLGCDPVTWNDTIAQSKEQVVATLREAAEAARG